MLTFDEFGAKLRLIVTDVFTTYLTKPDDDWPARVFGCDATGAFFTHDVDGFFTGPTGKDFFVAVALPVLFRAERAQLGAMVVSAWYLALKEPELGAVDRYQREGIEQHPDRTERLMMQVATIDRVEEWHAEIARSEQRPTLGPWMRLDDEVVHYGRMANPVQNALRVARP